jgi:hypothetical protein
VKHECFPSDPATRDISTGERFVERTELAERFVEGNSYGVGKVQRAHGSERRDPDDPIGVVLEQDLGQSDTLSAEDKGVTGCVDRPQVAYAREGAEKMQASLRTLFRPCAKEGGEIGMCPNVDEIPVVHAGASDAVLVDSKPEPPHEMKRRGRRGTQPRDIARVGRNLRLDEDDVQRRCERFRAKAWGRVRGHVMIYLILLDDPRAVLFFGAAAAALAGACHDTPAAVVGVSPPRAPELSVAAPDAGAPEPSPVPDDFRSTMTQVGGPFLSRGHAQRFDAIVWANAAAGKQWDSPGEMPVGAMLVEEALVREGASDRPAGLLVMEKREAGWRFVVVTAEGEVQSGPHLTLCETCHREASGGVFVLSREAGSEGAKETPPSR